jgi:hypothetical protein
MKVKGSPPRDAERLERRDVAHACHARWVDDHVSVQSGCRNSTAGEFVASPSAPLLEGLTRREKQPRLADGKLTSNISYLSSSQRSSCLATRHNARLLWLCISLCSALVEVNLVESAGNTGTSHCLLCRFRVRHAFAYLCAASSCRCEHSMLLE